MRSLAGKFLLANSTLLDPNFARSIVLIVRHDEDGAFGFVVNRPMPGSVAEIIGPTVPAATDCLDPVYFGGPCQGPVFAFHGDAAWGGDSPLAGVYVTSDRQTIEALLQDHAKPLKILATYSGWGSAQLEGEIADGSWTVCDARPADVFDPGRELWTRLHTRLNLERYIRPDRIPDDPSMN